MQRIPVSNDLERQLTIGAYFMGDQPNLLRLMLDELPCEGVTAVNEDAIAFSLPGSRVVLRVGLLADS